MRCQASYKREQGIARSAEWARERSHIISRLLFVVNLAVANAAKGSGMGHTGMPTKRSTVAQHAPTLGKRSRLIFGPAKTKKGIKHACAPGCSDHSTCSGAQLRITHGKLF